MLTFAVLFNSFSHKRALECFYDFYLLTISIPEPDKNPVSVIQVLTS